MCRFQIINKRGERERGRERDRERERENHVRKDCLKHTRKKKSSSKARFMQPSRLNRVRFSGKILNSKKILRTPRAKHSTKQSKLKRVFAKK